MNNEQRMKTWRFTKGFVFQYYISLHKNNLKLTLIYYPGIYTYTVGKSLAVKRYATTRYDTEVMIQICIVKHRKMCVYKYLDPHLSGHLSGNQSPFINRKWLIYPEVSLGTEVSGYVYGIFCFESACGQVWQQIAPNTNTRFFPFFKW